MKALVIFYSRTGTTKKVAESISSALRCDVEEIIDPKNRSGPIGYLKSGRDAMMKKIAKIDRAKRDPADYDTIIIGTPVWAGRMTPAIRTYIMRYGEHLPNVAFFCTQGGSGGENTLAEMSELCKKPARAEIILRTKEVMDGSYSEKLKEFINKLR
jgi:flavodoxin